MTNADKNKDDIPSAASFANRACIVFGLFILPVIVLRSTTDSLYCPVPVATTLPRFAHWSDTGIIAPSGICIYEMSCVLILIFRAMFIFAYRRSILALVMGRGSSAEYPTEFFPKAVWLYAGCSAVLFMELITKFDVGGRYETIKTAFITLGLGAGFSFFTPSVVFHWIVVMRTRMARKRK